MKQASLKDANAAYFASLRGREVVEGRAGERPDDAETGQQDEGQGLDPTADEQERRRQLMDAIEEATGKRPGANTKTETMEQRLAELEAEGQGEQSKE